MSSEYWSWFWVISELLGEMWISSDGNDCVKMCENMLKYVVIGT